MATGTDTDSLIPKMPKMPGKPPAVPGTTGAHTMATTEPGRKVDMAALERSGIARGRAAAARNGAAQAPATAPTQAPARAPAGGAGAPVRREAAPTVGQGGDLPGVSGRLTGLLASDSPYLERARTRGRQFANRRGLLNSSIAAGAAEASAIDAALPIAQGDAQIAAGERGMRSQEFQQLRSIRSQELMQQKGLDHDTAQRQADRELSTALQKRDLEVRQLMQQKGLDHAAAQAELQRQFAARQAALDREATRLAQQRGLDHETALGEAQRRHTQKLATDASRRSIDQEYQRSLTVLSANTQLPVEERRRLEEHFAFLRDEQHRGVQGVYDVDLTWESTRQPAQEPVGR